MDWVLEHIQLLLLIAGVVAAWLIKSREEKIKRLEKQRRGGVEMPVMPMEDEERVLDVREVIRRRMEERLEEMGITEDGVGVEEKVFEEGETGLDLGEVPATPIREVELTKIPTMRAVERKQGVSRGGLKGSGELRRAMVLKEILGKPAGWR